MTRWGRALRRGGRIGASLAASAIAGIASTLGAGTAQALPVPTAPSNPLVAEQWEHPAVRPADGEGAATIALVSGPGSVTEGDDLVLRVAVHNTTDETLSELSVTPRRGPISASVADSRAAAVADTSEYSVAAAPVEVPGSIAPDTTVEFDLTIPTDPDQPGSLPLPGNAVYPVLLELSAAGEYLDSERFHVHAAGTDTDNTRQVPQVSMLYPLTAPADILPGETGEAPEQPALVLASEQLAADLAPSGRLSQLLSAYTDATQTPAGRALAQATCLAVDPALVHTVERMTHGYTVAEDRAPIAREPRRLRDSWEDDGTTIASSPGIGKDDAAAWLEDLRAVAQDNCVVALPWANADLNAVARSGSPWLTREALERAPFTLEAILGTPTVHNVVIPPAGYVVQEAVPALGWADHSRSTVPEGGMQAEWERARAQEQPSTGATIPVEGEQVTNLDRTLPPHALAAVAPAPQQPVRVVVADNTVSRETSDDPQAARFAGVGENITAVTFQASLAATLAETGTAPETTGFSHPAFREDFTKDSPAARDITAANAVRIAVGEATTANDEPLGSPVMITPPATWQPDTATHILDTVGELMNTRQARPIALEDYLTPPPVAPIPQATEVGTPFPDPTVFSDSEILSVGQQAAYADDLTAFLVADPAIALTRYGFTLPLRRDLLTAASLTHRRSAELYNRATERTGNRLNATRDTLNELRTAVRLVPPGNVYTRTSEASPLLIVAQNGLPLPVDAAVLYEAPDDVRLNTPDQIRIPARGSITLQMTADLPEQRERTDIKLYLATPQGNPISRPVLISVQTAANEVAALTVGGLLAAFLLLVVVFRRVKRRKAPRDSLERPPDR